MEKVVRHKGFWMFFTWTYWRIQLGRMFGGQAPLNIIETVEIELPDEETEKFAG
jgi:hypothetical protein